MFINLSLFLKHFLFAKIHYINNMIKFFLSI
nr:MAG TPA: hypothetical protein [Microviridae sp.]